jgi:hypothetical protein
MIRLTATRISDEIVLLLNGRADGRVHSVFEAAMNVQVSDALITFLAAERSLQPCSIVLAEAVSFSEMGFRVKDVVYIAPDVIRFGEYAVVDTRGAKEVSLLMPPWGIGIDSLTYNARLRMLEQAISQSKEMEESLAPVLCHLFPDLQFHVVHNVWSDFLVERIRRLYEVLCRCNVDACQEVGRSIAGCGPGLTPSSDDFLVGVFAALYGAAAAGKLDGTIAANLCNQLSAGAVSQTGIISASFLKSGARGNFGEEINNLVSSFFAGGNHNADLMELAVRVCQEGSTSGVDTLAGIWFGLTACRGMDGVDYPTASILDGSHRLGEDGCIELDMNNKK